MPKDAPTGLEVLPVEGYLRQAALLKHYVPFSAATLWRNVRAGTFPAPVKLSQRVTAWRIADIRRWMASVV